MRERVTWAKNFYLNTLYLKREANLDSSELHSLHKKSQVLRIWLINKVWLTNWQRTQNNGFHTALLSIPQRVKIRWFASKWGYLELLRYWASRKMTIHNLKKTIYCRQEKMFNPLDWKRRKLLILLRKLALELLILQILSLEEVIFNP